MAKINTIVKNKDRFSDVASLYSKFRPSYPKELIDFLFSQVGFIRSSVIADIGSGTGIFSRLLLEMGCYVYCVEPNDDMRQISETFLRESELKNFIFIKASAENTGLHEKSIDFITVAQAFHWFDRATFKMECNRILKNDGKVVLMWNMRDFETEIIKKEYELREKYCVGTHGLKYKDMNKRDVQDFFKDNKYEVRIFRNDLLLNREAYIGMNLSGSYSPNKKKNMDKYNGLIMELNMFFDEYNSNGLILFPQFTECYIGRI